MTPSPISSWLASFVQKRTWFGSNLIVPYMHVVKSLTEQLNKHFYKIGETYSFTFSIDKKIAPNRKQDLWWLIRWCFLGETRITTITKKDETPTLWANVRTTMPSKFPLKRPKIPRLKLKKEKSDKPGLTTRFKSLSSWNSVPILSTAQNEPERFSTLDDKGNTASCSGKLYLEQQKTNQKKQAVPSQVDSSTASAAKQAQNKPKEDICRNGEKAPKKSNRTVFSRFTFPISAPFNALFRNQKISKKDSVTKTHKNIEIRNEVILTRCNKQISWSCLYSITYRILSRVSRSLPTSNGAIVSCYTWGHN